MNRDPARLFRPATNLCARVGRLAILATALSLSIFAGAFAKTAHPMDALTAPEVARAVELISAAGHSDETSRFPTIALKEMAKEEVLAWKPGDPVTRTAFVVMYHQGETYEIDVDLTSDEITSIGKVDGEPGVIIDEWLAASELTIADERWRAAIAKRGITAFERVLCSPLTAGYFDGADYGGRRIMKVPCYLDEPGSSHLYGRPIEGVFAVVDVEAREVIDVVDLGVVDAAEAPETVEWARQPFRPVVLSSPQGANFKLSGAFNVAWGPWDFHMRVDKRVGPIISLLRYDDAGRKRLVAYQMSLSEMFVPYMAPGRDWSYRTFIDSGEFGAGSMLSSLVPGADCPDQAAYLTVGIPNDRGQVYQVRRAACIFERTTGDPLWRHGTPAQPTLLTRPQIELVMRTIPSIGNYDYVIDWVFTQQGNIEIRVGAAGIIAVRRAATARVGDPTSEADTAYGTLVAPGTIGINHDHFFSFRLDLDVDGPQNLLLRESIVPQRLPSSNPRRSLWTVERVPISQEGPVSAEGFDAIWRVVNPELVTALGHNPGFEIVPGHHNMSVLAADDSAQARAAFSAHELWLTRYKPNEVHAAGDYPNLSHGGDGLPAYVSDRDGVENADLVLWYTVGFHHVPRAEDWPIMPTRWHGFTLRPFNFFKENPAYGIPPAFAQPEPPALRSTIDSGGAQ